MKTSTQGAFKRPTTSLEETEPTRWRTMWNGRTTLQKCEPNTCGIVQRAHTIPAHGLFIWLVENSPNASSFLARGLPRPVETVSSVEVS